MFITSNKPCEQVRRSIDSYLSGEPDGASKDEIGWHLETCPACSTMVEERLRVKHLIQRAVRRETAPGSLRRAIQETIRQN